MVFCWYKLKCLKVVTRISNFVIANTIYRGPMYLPRGCQLIENLNMLLIMSE